MAKIAKQETAEYALKWLTSAMESAYRVMRPKSEDKLSVMGRKFRNAKITLSIENMYSDLIDMAMESDKFIFRACLERGRLYVFNGKYYDGIDKPVDFLKELVKRALEAESASNAVTAKIAAVKGNAIWSRLTWTDRYSYAPKRRYIAFTNGIFDLKDGKLKEFSPRYETELVLDIPYVDVKTHYVDCEKRHGHADNPCRLWDSFVGRSAGEGVIPNSEMREAFQSFCGAMLVDKSEYKIEKFCIVHGPGRNGKSVLVDAIRGVFGDAYFTSFTLDELKGESVDAGTKRWEASGKLMNITGDMDYKAFSSDFFKRVVSCESMSARLLYSNDRINVQWPLFIGCTNQLPDTKDDSVAYFERLLPIASTRKIWTDKDKDPKLTNKLNTEDARIYIFSWIYEGYKRVVKHNGIIPLGDAVRDAMNALKRDSSSMRRWLYEHCAYRVPREDEEAQWVPFYELLSGYHKYCDQYRERAESTKSFGLMLSSEGFEKRRRHGGQIVYKAVVKGLSISQEED